MHWATSSRVLAPLKPAASLSSSRSPNRPHPYGRRDILDQRYSQLNQGTSSDGPKPAALRMLDGGPPIRPTPHYCQRRSNARVYRGCRASRTGSERRNPKPLQRCRDRPHQVLRGGVAPGLLNGEQVLLKRDRLRPARCIDDGGPECNMGARMMVRRMVRRRCGPPSLPTNRLG
jgi:hypothetical protein